MRIPNAVQESYPWRIRAIVPDFELEDVWALPVFGGLADFAVFLTQNRSSDPADSRSLPTRFLWRFRDRLGTLLRIGKIAAPSGDDASFAIPGTGDYSLATRLPADLRDTAAGMTFTTLPFAPLFVTGDEFAAEISNATMHGVMHVAWVARGNGRYQAQMAVYVKTRGKFGKAYMAFIKPFRHWIVYPALMKQTGLAWQRHASKRP